MDAYTYLYHCQNFLQNYAQNALISQKLRQIYTNTHLCCDNA